MESYEESVSSIAHKIKYVTDFTCFFFLGVINYLFWSRFFVKKVD